MKGYAVVSIVVYVQEGDTWHTLHSTSARINDCYEGELALLNQTQYDRANHLMSQTYVSFFPYLTED